MWHFIKIYMVQIVDYIMIGHLSAKYLYTVHVHKLHVHKCTCRYIYTVHVNVCRDMYTKKNYTYIYWSYFYVFDDKHKNERTVTI